MLLDLQQSILAWYLELIKDQSEKKIRLRSLVLIFFVPRAYLYVFALHGPEFLWNMSE